MDDFNPMPLLIICGVLAYIFFVFWITDKVADVTYSPLPSMAVGLSLLLIPLGILLGFAP